MACEAPGGAGRNSVQFKDLPAAPDRDKAAPDPLQVPVRSARFRPRDEAAITPPLPRSGLRLSVVQPPTAGQPGTDARP